MRNELGVITLKQIYHIQDGVKHINVIESIVQISSQENERPCSCILRYHYNPYFHEFPICFCIYSDGMVFICLFLFVLYFLVQTVECIRKKRRYLIHCTRRVSEISFIRYSHQVEMLEKQIIKNLLDICPIYQHNYEILMIARQNMPNNERNGKKQLEWVQAIR